MSEITPPENPLPGCGPIEESPSPTPLRLEPPNRSAEPAKLRIYIGAAPGVGKTFNMLHDSNVPGSKNRKRYEDVLELLDAGINVLTAVNIQHLETLNDAVGRSANTVIRETVPDSFLKRADEVVNVDLTVDELRTRLRSGKIYAPEKVEQSLANFFRKGNLNLLRELSLRTTAEQVGNRAAEYRRTQD